MSHISIPFSPEHTPRELVEAALARLAPVVCGKHPCETLELDAKGTLDNLAQTHRLCWRMEFEHCPECPFRTGEQNRFFEWYRRANSSNGQEFAPAVPACAALSGFIGFHVQQPDFRHLKQPSARFEARIDPDASPRERLHRWRAEQPPVACSFATHCTGAETPLPERGERFWLSPAYEGSLSQRLAPFYEAIHGPTELDHYRVEPVYFACPACALAGAGVPPIHLHSAFDRFRVDPPEIAGHLERCREFAKDPRGTLVMLGNVGNGKTYLAVAIARACLRTRRPLFITHADFLRRHRLTYAVRERGEARPENVLQACEEAPLLIFDDLGRRQPGRDEESLLHDLLDHRYAHYRPTIITSNLTRADFEQFVGPALFDRLRESCAAILPFDFPSKRPGLNDDYLTH